MLSSVCGFCGIKSHFTIRSKQVELLGNDPTSMYLVGLIVSCDNCRSFSMAEVRLEQRVTDGIPMHANFVENVLNNPHTETSWFPSPKSELTTDFSDVPEIIAQAAAEAMACHSHGFYTAAILLARSVIEAAAKNQGIETGTLSQKIEKMNAEGVIGRAGKDLAHDIRHSGNEMAHGDFSRVNSEDSEEILFFMSVVLAEVFQLPARHNRVIAKRNRPTTLPGQFENGALSSPGDLLP